RPAGTALPAAAGAGEVRRVGRLGDPARRRRARPGRPARARGPAGVRGPLVRVDVGEPGRTVPGGRAVRLHRYAGAGRGLGAGPRLIRPAEKRPGRWIALSLLPQDFRA